MGQQCYTKTAAKAQVIRKMPSVMDETPYMIMECMCAHILWKLSTDRNNQSMIQFSSESFTFYS